MKVRNDDLAVRYEALVVGYAHFHLVLFDREIVDGQRCFVD